MLRMIAVALKICLCGEDSDDCEVVIRCGETDIAATYVAFDTVEVGDEGAERVPQIPLCQAFAASVAAR